MKPLTPEEVDAIDPAFIDSVTGDRLIEALRSARSALEMTAGSHATAIHGQVALWLADQQGELEEAAGWAVNGVCQWIDIDDIATDPWAHDWRKFWNSRDSISGKDAAPCGICGEPSTIWSGIGATRLAACNERHWKALHGRLPDEQCRLCNEVTVCAHDLAGSPVCAVCWPVNGSWPNGAPNGPPGSPPPLFLLPLILEAPVAEPTPTRENPDTSKPVFLAAPTAQALMQQVRREFACDPTHQPWVNWGLRINLDSVGWVQVRCAEIDCPGEAWVPLDLIEDTAIALALSTPGAL